MEEKLKINDRKLVFSLLLYLSIICTFVSKIFVQISFLDNIKYVLFLFTILIGVYNLIKNYQEGTINYQYVYIKELMEGLIIIAVFLLLTLYYCIINKENFQTRTIIELSYIFIPFICSFCMINLLNQKEIVVIVKLLLFSSLILYIVELFQFDITLDKIKEISFIESYSPFESHVFADISLVCFCFFSYFRNKKDRVDTICYYLSFIFSLFVFKRILLIFTVVIFILDKFSIWDKKINKKVIFVIGVGFVIFTMGYTWLLDENHTIALYNLLGINLDKLTMGRQWFFRVLQQSGFQSAGYGSSSTAIYALIHPISYLEMDLVKINIELGCIGLITFVWGYWKQIYNNLFSVVVMFFMFVNLFFSHSLTTFHVWIITLTMFYLIKRKEQEILPDM